MNSREIWRKRAIQKRTALKRLDLRDSLVLLLTLRSVPVAEWVVESTVCPEWLVFLNLLFADQVQGGTLVSALESLNSSPS